LQHPCCCWNWLPTPILPSAATAVLPLHLAALQGNNPRTTPFYHYRGLLPAEFASTTKHASHAGAAAGCCNKHLNYIFINSMVDSN